MARRGGRLAFDRRGICCGRAGGVRAARVSRLEPAGGYFACGLATGFGVDCVPLFAAWAVFASAPAGAAWCALSPPFAMVLTPFHLAWRSAPARRKPQGIARPQEPDGTQHPLPPAGTPAVEVE